MHTYLLPPSPPHTYTYSDELWRVMDRSNPSTSSIFNNERSFLWLHADQLPFDLTVTRPSMPPPVIEPEELCPMLYVSRCGVPSSSAFQHGISVHGYKYVPRVSLLPSFTRMSRRRRRSSRRTSYIDKRTNRVSNVEGWWMERGNNFTWRCFRTRGYENTKVGAMMGVTWTRWWLWGKVLEAWF